MSESDQKRERERESECGAKRICVNNGVVFKFRFVVFMKNCMVTRQTQKQVNKTDKFRIEQIEQKC